MKSKMLCIVTKFFFGGRLFLLVFIIFSPFCFCLEMFVFFALNIFNYFFKSSLIFFTVVLIVNVYICFVNLVVNSIMSSKTNKIVLVAATIEEELLPT